MKNGGKNWGFIGFYGIFMEFKWGFRGIYSNGV
jgi:hypothetical protein